MMQAIREGSTDDRSHFLDGYFPYETIKFTGRLKIVDPQTRTARFVRRQRVRFLEDLTSVFFDRIWGDGVFFASYRAPGLRILEPIRTKKGYVVPLALPRLFNKGDEFEIVTERAVHGAFYDPVGYWEIAMPVPTDLAKISVVTPPGMELRQPDVVVPARGDISAEQRPQSLSFRVTQPAMNIPYRLAWSWK